MSTPRPRANALADIIEIARFELRELWTTRASLALVALYSGGTVLGCFGFAGFLRLMGSIANQSMGMSGDPGRTGVEMLRDENIRSFLEGLDPEGTLGLVDTPMVGFQQGVSVIAVPLLVILLSSSAVSRDIASGGVRYHAVRAGRLEFVLGRALGQAVIHAAVLLLVVPIPLLAVMVLLPGFPLGAHLVGLLRLAVQAWCFSLHFLGIALCASQVTSSGVGGQALGFASTLGLFLVWGLSGLESVASRIGPLSDLLQALMPFSYWADLGSNDPAVLIPALMFTAVLSAGWLLLGQIVFARRNL